jgi:hypothetical protein
VWYAGHQALVHKRHALSPWKSTKACMRREIILMWRHKFVYFFRLIQVDWRCSCSTMWSSAVLPLSFLFVVSHSSSLFFCLLSQAMAATHS